MVKYVSIIPEVTLMACKKRSAKDVLNEAYATFVCMCFS